MQQEGEGEGEAAGRPSAVTPERGRGRWMPMVGLLVVAAVAAAAYALRDRIPARWIQQARLLVHGVDVDHEQRVTTRDGVTLRGTLYLPRRQPRPLATILIRLPYGRDAYGEALGAATFFSSHGYAVLVQDVRGKYGSGGQFLPWQHATEDGVDTLDWLVGQPWSNGKVGTWGCSALGELQYALARARHPAHGAMVPIGAGGAAGSVGGRYGYFGVYEGGVFQLASAFGWLLRHGEIDPASPALEGGVDLRSALQTLPVSEMVSRLRPAPNGWDQFTLRSLTDASWAGLGYVDKADTIAVPTLDINSWGDQTLDGTLALAEQAQRTSPATPHHVVIAPGNHCELGAMVTSFGDMPVRNGQLPYDDWYLRWFDQQLRGHGPWLADLPAYRYFMLGEDRWLSAAQWPPESAVVQRWYLDGDGRANSREGDGRLVERPSVAAAADTYVHDPLDPVPSRGGPLCCTGNPSDRSGPVDQAEVERRNDVLVYTSAPLQRPLRIAGPLSARLVVDTSAADTDFIARLVDVAPDGRTLGLQEGALRLRYRRGVDADSPVKPGERYEIDVSMRSIAVRIPVGHRLRLDLASSSFPRLERNLGGAGENLQASRAVSATNRVHHGPQALSFLSLPVLPVDDAGAAVVDGR